MSNKIIVAGATGALGGRIVKELLLQKADVVALVRPDSSDQKIENLKADGAMVIESNFSRPELTAACAGASMVVSALQGLKDVVVDLQSDLLHAAIAADVPRFIPSDFSSNYNQQPVNENRNFDLRREFHKVLDAASIRSTTIFNGAFGEILTYNTPLLDLKARTVGYWEDANWKIDFTTIDDVAKYTARVALDDESPRQLTIASFQASPNDLVELTAKLLAKPFDLARLGSLNDLAAYNRAERAAHPEGEQELYPSWQQSQYMQSMFTVHHSRLDNERYPGMSWTNLEDVVKQLVLKN